MTGVDARWVLERESLEPLECKAEVLRHRADTIYLILMGGRVVAMQTGFAMLESAFGQKMNAANIMMKNTMDLLLGSLVFYIIGYQIAFGEASCLFEERPFDYAMWFLQFSYATTAATITSGALAGRVAFGSYLALSVTLTGLIYPVAVRWAWGGGWLQDVGYYDFAGSTVVHMMGAVSALVCICICGPRIGRFTAYKPWEGIWKFVFLERYDAEFYAVPSFPREKAIYSEIKDVTNPVQCLFGAFLLVTGFLAFNPASTFATTNGSDALAARTTVTTFLSLSAAPLGCWMQSLVRKGSWVITVPDAATAIVASLVASSACCAVVPPLLCVIVSLVAVLLALATQWALFRWHFDDAVSAVAAHGPPGAWGVLSVPLFARPHCGSELKGLVFGGGQEAGKLLGAQCLGIAALVAFTALATWLVVVAIDLVVGFRCERAKELIGLDFMEHEYYDQMLIADPDKAQLISQSMLRDTLVARLMTKSLASPQKSWAQYLQEEKEGEDGQKEEEEEEEEEEVEQKQGPLPPEADMHILDGGQAAELVSPEPGMQDVLIDDEPRMALSRQALAAEGDRGHEPTQPRSTGPVLQEPVEPGVQDLVEELNQLKIVVALMARQLEELLHPVGDSPLSAAPQGFQGTRALALGQLLERARESASQHEA